MIAVLHAYSRRNAGDSLLVDLTLERLQRLGIGSENIRLFALDAPSFADLPGVHQVGTPRRDPTLAMIPASKELVLGSTPFQRGDLDRVLADVDGIVSVGGGYLRTRGLVNSIGTLINHVPQLRAASRARIPSFYMPQSIGPLQGPVGRAVRRYLHGIDLVCLRDDRSMSEITGSNTMRCPDLAVLSLAEDLPRAAIAVSQPIVLIGRALPRPDGYQERLRNLADRLQAVWAVQAEGEGAKSDLLFYERLGVRSEGRLEEVLTKHPGAVVVSVRLHGALQALMEGSPAIHLGYERKSWSAFADLGIPGFVHDARLFDPKIVAEQALSARADPSVLWDQMAAAVSRLKRSSNALTSQLGTVLGTG